MEILQKLKNLNLVNKDFLTIASNQIRGIIEKGYYDISDKFLRFNNIKNLKDIFDIVDEAQRRLRKEDEQRKIRN